MSQALLAAAALVATSRQELLRIQAQTAASLEETNASIAKLGAASTSDAALLAACATTQTATTSQSNAANDDMRTALDDLRAELVALRADANAGLAAVASNTGRLANKLDDVTSASGGDAIAIVQSA